MTIAFENLRVVTIVIPTPIKNYCAFRKLSEIRKMPQQTLIQALREVQFLREKYSIYEAFAVSLLLYYFYFLLRYTLPFVIYVLFIYNMFIYLPLIHPYVTIVKVRQTQSQLSCFADEYVAASARDFVISIV